MVGFTMYDFIHISWLIVISIFLFILVYYYKKCSIVQKLRIQKTVFFGLLVLEISKQLFLLVTNQYSYWSPPLHLCGLGIFIIGWHSYFPNRTATEILYSLTLPGALAALLIPGWTNEPLFSYIHFNSFIFHTLLVGYVFMLLATKELQPRMKELWRSVLFLIITVPPTYYYNQTFGTNFMFINRPLKGSPLETFEQWFGNPGYLIGFFGLVFIVWVIMYIPFIGCKKRISS